MRNDAMPAHDQARADADVLTAYLRLAAQQPAPAPVPDAPLWLQLLQACGGQDVQGRTLCVVNSLMSNPPQRPSCWSRSSPGCCSKATAPNQARPSPCSSFPHSLQRPLRNSKAAQATHHRSRMPWLHSFNPSASRLLSPPPPSTRGAPTTQRWDSSCKPLPVLPITRKRGPRLGQMGTLSWGGMMPPSWAADLWGLRRSAP